MVKLQAFFKGMNSMFITGTWVCLLLAFVLLCIMAERKLQDAF
jgi:hypothetical protein